MGNIIAEFFQKEKKIKDNQRYKLVQHNSYLFLHLPLIRVTTGRSIRHCDWLLCWPVTLHCALRDAMYTGRFRKYITWAIKEEREGEREKSKFITRNKRKYFSETEYIVYVSELNLVFIRYLIERVYFIFVFRRHVSGVRTNCLREHFVLFAANDPRGRARFPPAARLLSLCVNLFLSLSVSHNISQQYASSYKHLFFPSYFSRKFRIVSAQKGNTNEWLN